MAHVLLMTSGLRGVVHASLEVARRLEASGHRVTYACPHDVGEMVATKGISYHQLPPVERQPAPQRERRSGESRWAHKLAEWSSRKERRNRGVTKLGMASFRAFLEELRPDVALVDFDLEEHVITCDSIGVRTVLLSQWFEFRRRPGLPPLASDLERGSGPQRAWAWAKQRFRSRARIAGTYLRYFGTDRRGVLVQYARQWGFPESSLWAHDWSTLFAFDHLPVWSMTAEELDFPHERRQNFTYLGPMVLGARSEGPGFGEARDRLKRIAAEARRSDQRIIYASISSMDQGADSFLHRLVQAVALRGDWVLILGLGGNQAALDDVSRVSSDAELSQVEPFLWAPQLHALEHADLFVTHGGIHSIHESLRAKTPMAVYSGSTFDQDGCAARLAFHGVASVGSRTETPQEIADRLQGALGNAPQRERLRALTGSFQRYDAVLDASLQTLLHSSPSPNGHRPSPA